MILHIPYIATCQSCSNDSILLDKRACRAKNSGEQYRVIGPLVQLNTENENKFIFCCENNKWALTQKDLYSGVCKQNRHRPACAYRQSDQPLLFAFWKISNCKLATGVFSSF